MIAKIIEEGYRRARKYGGSTGIITQSPLDLRAFGPAGAVIKANSAFKFFLESSDYQEAVNTGVLEYSGLLLDLAKTVKNNRPRYSEVLFDTPFGSGVGRLCVDPWTYWMNTSTATEVAKFKRLIAQGIAPKDAIDQLAASQ
jgi:conjugal transfer ATP-binding protein TraC